MTRRYPDLRVGHSRECEHGNNEPGQQRSGAGTCLMASHPKQETNGDWNNRSIF